MEARVVSTKEFAAMLGVSDKLAATHMRNQCECLNVGIGTSYEYLRLPLWVAEEIVSGKRPLSPIMEKAAAKKVNARAVSPARRSRAKAKEPLYVKKR